MGTQLIRSKLAERLEKHRHLFDSRASTQIHVKTEEARALLAEACPPELEVLREQLIGRSPTHVLLRPAELESLLTARANGMNDGKTQRPAKNSDRPAAVQGLGRPSVDAPA